MKILGYVRLSDVDDDTTSPERQRAKIEGYAKLHDSQIIGIAEDLDVSGKVSPFNRPGLGPWLNGKSGEWDAIVIWKLDRLTRSLGDFIAVMTWCETYGKKIISVEESLDFSTPVGRMFAQLLAMFAQFERETTAMRVKQWYGYRQAQGKYAGMQCPFGLRPDGNGGLEHDPVYAPIVREMAGKLLAGQSLNKIARWLNDTGIPTSRNIVRMRSGNSAQPSRWAGHTVRKIMAGRGILGEVTSDGKPVHDEHGHIVSRCAPIIDHDQWQKIQAILAGHPAHARVDSSPLTGIAVCGICGSPMHIKKARTAGKLYRYYGCTLANRQECTNRRVNADAMETRLRDEFMKARGNVAYMQAVITSGRDDAKIAQLAETIGALSAKLAMARAVGQPAEVLEAQVAEIQAELSAAMTGSAEPTIETYSTDKTMGDVFDSLGENERNLWLRSAGVTVTGKRDQAGTEITVDLGMFTRPAGW